MSKPEQLIAFLNKYTLTYTDAHTAIITEQQSCINLNFQTLPKSKSNNNINTKLDQSSLAEIDQFLNRTKNADKNKDTSFCNFNSNKMPTCYLLKDMILQDGENADNCQSQLLRNVLQTLMMHQQLTNKYLLSLIHHQVFIKYVPTQCHQSPKKSCEITQAQHRTQLECSSYSSSSMKNQQYEVFQERATNNQIQQQSQVAQISGSSVSLIQQPKTAIRAIYEYGKLTLKEQIGNRIASSTQFEEEELWAIMAAVVQALAYLEVQGIVYGVLGADKIFINNSLVKVLDPSATATDPLLIAQGRLYSPEILNDQQNINMFKSDIFIIGLIIVQCGLLIDLSKQAEPNIGKYLSVFKQKYSNQLTQILEMCLMQNPDDRPSFQDLLKFLEKQLDMVDFQGAYDSTSSNLLNPVPYDQQDFCNPQVPEIQYEFQETNFDVLYESVSEEESQCKKRALTDFQRAKIRFLGITDYQESRKTYSRSSMIRQKEMEMNRKDAVKSKQKHKKSSSSAHETRRNSQTHYNQGSHPSRLPGLNMAICQSVYTDQIIPITSSNRQKTNRKRNNPQNEYYTITCDRVQKQNINQYQQQNARNTNTTRSSQNIKKTKMIKQKLVKNAEVNENINIEHTFGAVKKVEDNRKANHSNSNSNSNKQQRQRQRYANQPYFIKQQAEQQSQSSLMYNINCYNRDQKNHQSVSQFSNNSDKIKGSLSRSSARYQQMSGVPVEKNKGKLEQQQLFTDPNLMQTIKEDLARISTTKNIKLQASNQDHRWFK